MFLIDNLIGLPYHMREGLRTCLICQMGHGRFYTNGLSTRYAPVKSLCILVTFFRVLYFCFDIFCLCFSLIFFLFLKLQRWLPAYGLVQHFGTEGILLKLFISRINTVHKCERLSDALQKDRSILICYV